jgi:NAD dependent epimerase/dehydratase family enzyme
MYRLGIPEGTTIIAGPSIQRYGDFTEKAAYERLFAADSCSKWEQEKQEEVFCPRL